MRDKILANIALFLTALIWGMSFVAQRAGMEYLGPFSFNAIRCILGGFSLIPVIFIVKISKPDTRTPETKHLQHIDLTKAGLACGIALFIAMSIQQYCMQFVSAGKAGFITALYIIFVPLLSIFFKEKIGKNIIISVILATIGLYFLCFNSTGCFDLYDVLLLLSAFFYGVHIIVVKFFSAKSNPIKISCIQFFVVGLLSFILVSIFETPTLNSVIACKFPILYAGLLTCGIAYTLQIYGQKYTNSTVASLILCLESVFAVIGGSIILQEAMSAREIIGCVFMITGVIISNTKLHVKRIDIKKLKHQ